LVFFGEAVVILGHAAFVFLVVVVVQGFGFWVLGFGFWVLGFGLCACVCAGIRALPSCFMRRPCAGRHLLFFAAAKKSRGGFKCEAQHNA
jgi:hypothetical protein